MTSIKSVAKRANVSIATVSRVYNKRANVKKETRDKVLKVSHELKYNPKVTARKESFVLVFDSFDMLNQGGYGAMIISALTAEIVRCGLRLEMVSSDDVELLQTKFIKAIISITYRDSAIERIKKLQNVPKVFINRKVACFDNVISDSANAFASVLKYISSQGHKKIGFIQHENFSWSAIDRLKALNANRHGIEVCNAVGPASDINLVADLAKIEEVTLIFAAGEEQGTRLIYSLNMLGLRVPEDISVICFEHSGVTEFLAKGLTALKQNFQKLSEHAIALALENNPKPQTVAVMHDFIERKSVKKIN